MLNRSIPVFDNPLVLYGHNRSALAFSGGREGDREKFLSGRAYAPFFAEGQGYSEAYAKGKAVIFSPCSRGLRSLYINIQRGEKLRYRLVVLEMVRKFNASDTALLEHLADSVALAGNGAVEKNDTPGKGGSAVLTRIFRDILLEEPVGAEGAENGGASEYLERRFGEQGWYKDQFYCCAWIPGCGGPLIRDLEKRIAGSLVIEYQNGAAIALNLDYSPAREEIVLEEMNLFLGETGLRAGVSRVFSGFGEFRFFFKQAELALELKRDNGGRICRFAEAVTPLLLESCVRDLPAAMVCAPELTQLRDYDALHHTAYFQTLRSYLENNQRPVTTIRELNIHRSTLIYRLERIQRITGINWENRDNQWYLLLSFKLLEYSGVTGG